MLIGRFHVPSSMTARVLTASSLRRRRHPNRDVGPPCIRPRKALLLAPGQTVESPETGFRYTIDRLLGEGGFGQVFLARRLGRSTDDARRSSASRSAPSIDGWLREAYFGQLLDDHPRAIRVYDTFPLVRGRRP